MIACANPVYDTPLTAGIFIFYLWTTLVKAANNIEKSLTYIARPPSSVDIGGVKANCKQCRINGDERKENRFRIRWSFTCAVFTTAE